MARCCSPWEGRQLGETEWMWFMGLTPLIWVKHSVVTLWDGGGWFTSPIITSGPLPLLTGVSREKRIHAGAPVCPVSFWRAIASQHYVCPVRPDKYITFSWNDGLLSLAGGRSADWWAWLEVALQSYIPASTHAWLTTIVFTSSTLVTYTISCLCGVHNIRQYYK